MLRTISVCQNTTCQDKGSKAILHRLETLYKEQYSSSFPELKIEKGDCKGDCEFGPIVRVNDSIVLREVEKEQVEELLRDPASVMGEVMHVLEKDRETFERIINGALF